MKLLLSKKNINEVTREKPKSTKHQEKEMIKNTDQPLCHSCLKDDSCKPRTELQTV